MVGSFLNVVIARVPKGESIVSPGSRCPRCKHEIAWYDNVPIVSWLILRARCRSCGLPISARYPMVELLVGVLALAISIRFGFNGASLGYFALAAALVALSYIDLDTWLLPHEITLPLLALGLLSPLWNGARVGFLQSAIGAAVGFSLFAAIALVGEKILHRETMGWGDVVLLGGIGAWLGWQALLPVVMLSALQGSVVGLIMLAAGRDLAKRGQGAAAAAPDAPKAAAPDTPAAAAPELAAPVRDAAAAPDAAAPRQAGAAEPAQEAAALTADEQAPAPEAGASALSQSGSAQAPELPALTGSEQDGDEDWTPPPHAVPYGPFLALAALQWLLLGDLLTRLYDDFLRRLWS